MMIKIVINGIDQYNHVDVYSPHVIIARKNKKLRRRKSASSGTADI